jgi:ribosomal protein L37AE/L43A
MIRKIHTHRVWQCPRCGAQQAVSPILRGVRRCDICRGKSRISHQVPGDGESGRTHVEVNRGNN